MGRLRRGSIDDVRVKVPRNPGAQKCAAELVGYLACLDANSGNDRQCGAAREALTACMGAASKTANAWRHKAPINFHLKQVCSASRASPSRPRLHAWPILDHACTRTALAVPAQREKVMILRRAPTCLGAASVLSSIPAPTGVDGFSAPCSRSDLRETLHGGCVRSEGVRAPRVRALSATRATTGERSSHDRARDMPARCSAAHDQLSALQLASKLCSHLRAQSSVAPLVDWSGTEGCPLSGERGPAPCAQPPGESAAAVC